MYIYVCFKTSTYTVYIHAHECIPKHHFSMACHIMLGTQGDKHPLMPTSLCQKYSREECSVHKTLSGILYLQRQAVRLVCAAYHSKEDRLTPVPKHLHKEHMGSKFACLKGSCPKFPLCDEKAANSPVMPSSRWNTSP